MTSAIRMSEEISRGHDEKIAVNKLEKMLSDFILERENYPRHSVIYLSLAILLLELFILEWKRIQSLGKHSRNLSLCPLATLSMNGTRAQMPKVPVNGLRQTLACGQLHALSSLKSVSIN